MIGKSTLDYQFGITYIAYIPNKNFFKTCRIEEVLKNELGILKFFKNRFERSGKHPKLCYIKCHLVCEVVIKQELK
jgi:hypothetical protein